MVWLSYWMKDGPAQFTDNKCKMLIKYRRSYSPFRPALPTLSHGFPGTDCCPPYGPGLASQPSRGTTSAPARQQALNPYPANVENMVSS